MRDSSASQLLRLLPLGDAALTVEFGHAIDPTLNARVMAFADYVRDQAWPGVLDVVPTYRSLTIHVDPLRLALTVLMDRLRGPLHSLPDRPQSPGRRHRIPVWYGAEPGPDLDDLATFARMPVADVVRLHSSVDYRVYMLGFTPGFPYLGPVPSPLAMPRLATPRTAVPAGSVGIAGSQTGIYPTSTPGGWRLIGRTPRVLYQAGRANPFLIEPGDCVRFFPIGREEFARLCEYRESQ